MNKELEKIKKLYGEKFAHLCRTLFPTVLEQEGFLLEILTNYFAPTRSLYDDIINQNKTIAFGNYINGVYQKLTKQELEVVPINKTAEEIMDEAGYILYPECKTEKEIQAFEKYYAPGEELCTFNGGRLAIARVWFAVKKNVDEIKRQDFTDPQRQDQYGTSVISIQFTRGRTSYLSIKNRYNHTVNNPDATFGNNLDNIAEGLTDAFVQEYNITLIDVRKYETFALKNYVLTYSATQSGTYYRYNINDDNGTYFCENNTIVVEPPFGGIIKLDSAKRLLIDNYILDLENKTLTNYSVLSEDSFPESVGKIKKISVKKIPGGKIITIEPELGENVIITIDLQNKITGYSNPNIKKIGNNFMEYNTGLQTIILPNVTKIGSNFLRENEKLESIDLPNVVSVGNTFLLGNTCLSKLNMPNLRICGSNFLAKNNSLTSLYLPSLQAVERGFIRINETISSIYLPNLRCTGRKFLENNLDLTEIDLPQLVVAEAGFLTANKKIKSANFPKLKKAGEYFMSYNNSLPRLDLPQLKTTGRCFLDENQSITELTAPKLKKMGYHFLSENTRLTTLKLESLENMDWTCLIKCESLNSVILPKIKEIPPEFISILSDDTVIYAPKCGYKGVTKKRILQKEAGRSL